MADTSVNYWINQLLRLNGKGEMQRPVEYANKEAGGDDGCCENGEKSIYRTQYTPTAGSPTAKRPMSTHRDHSFPLNTDDTLPLSPPSPKSGGASPTHSTTYLTPEQIADAAAVLAQLATTPSKDTQYLNMFNNTPKCIVDESSTSPVATKRHLKRTNSFSNHHSNRSRSTSPRQQTASTSSHVDIAEALATSVSLVRENNRRLGKMSDGGGSEGSNENENSYFSEVSADDYDDDDCLDDDDMEDPQSLSTWDNKAIKDEIQGLGAQLESMEVRYKEQLMGKDHLIEELDRALRKSEKDGKRKTAEIKRLEEKLEASRRAIAEVVNQQQRESEMLQKQASPDPQTVEKLRHLEAELREKNKTITDLNKRFAVTTQQITESKEKEKKLEVLANQLLRYQTLEIEWKSKQQTLDGLSSQLELLRKREQELNEKDALIESLNIRLDTSQQVIAELREKHAPHDLLRQLRQKDYIIDNLTQQVENTDADLKEKDDKIDALALELAEEAKSMEKLREQNAQLGPLRARVEEADGIVSHQRQQLSEKERLLADLEFKYRESSRNAEDSTEKLYAQEKTIATLRQEVVELRRTFTTQSSLNREKDRLIANMRDETAHIRSNFQGLMNALSEKDQKIQQLDQHIESLQQQAIAAAVKSSATAKDPKSSNKSEVRLNALQKVLNTKIEACREYEKKISQLDGEFATLKKQLDENKTTSSEKELKIHRLVKMNRELKEEVTQLKEKMEAKEQELIIIKSRIPHPSPGSAPAASVRSSRMSRSRVSSMYSLSGGESSSDESKKVPGHVCKSASLSGIESLSKARSSTITRRFSDSVKMFPTTPTVPSSTLTRSRSTKSTISTTSSNEDTTSFRRKVARTEYAVKQEIRSRLPSKPSTIEVLKKKSPATPKEASPINRSAVTQRKRDMAVLNTMLSGVAPNRKSKLNSTVTTTNKTRAVTSSSSSLSTLANRKKLDDPTSSDSDAGERKRTSIPLQSRRPSSLATIVERDAKAKVKSTTTATRPSVMGSGSPTTTKPRTSLTRPLPSRKPSSTA